MVFRRSNRGLANLHAFKGVDLVLFTEGGEKVTFSVEEVKSGRFHSVSDDIIFWRGVFSEFRPELKVDYRSVGSRKTLSALANDVGRARVPGIIFAMDRDFDDVFGLMDNSNVIYTRCYSWESELFSAQVIARTFRTLAPGKLSLSAALRTFRPHIAVIDADLRRFVRIDILLCGANRSLFIRAKPNAAVGSLQSGIPCVRASYLRQRTQDVHDEVGAFRLIYEIKKLSVSKLCFGKVLSAFSIKILQYELTRHRMPKLPNQYCVNFLRESFFKWINEASGCIPSRYYRSITRSI